MKIDRAEVVRLFGEGLNGVQVAKRLGCAPNSISVIKSKLGIESKAVKAATAQQTEHPALLPYLTRDCALTNEQIAEATGLPIRTVWAARVRAIGKRYSTERDHLATQLADWPTGIQFEDAVVPQEPRFRGTPPAFGFSVTGNSSAMCAAKLGFI